MSCRSCHGHPACPAPAAAAQPGYGRSPRALQCTEVRRALSGGSILGSRSKARRQAAAAASRDGCNRRSRITVAAGFPDVLIARCTISCDSCDSCNRRSRMCGRRFSGGGDYLATRRSFPLCTLTRAKRGAQRNKLRHLQ